MNWYLHRQVSVCVYLCARARVCVCVCLHVYACVRMCACVSWHVDSSAHECDLPAMMIKAVSLQTALI